MGQEQALRNIRYSDITFLVW